MSTNKQRRKMAEVHMHDALQTCISRNTRAVAAFDAGYTWLLAALDTPTGQVHPRIEVIELGAEAFDIDQFSLITPKKFLERQYSYQGVDDLLDELLTWSQMMKELAERHGLE